MSGIRERVAGFFRSRGMDLERIDLEECCQVFLDEMTRGLEGRESSLLMLPTHLEVSAEIPPDEKVVALDAGGTHFRAASIHFDRQGRVVIENLRTFPMPGTQGPVSREEFFRTIVRNIEPVAGAGQRIGFCFSYPIEILPNRDGRLLRFTKEIKAEEVVGHLIGENLIAALSDAGYGGARRAVLLNDTVATLLAGRSAAGQQAYDGYVGLILGTGTNCAYVEQNRRIVKNPDLDPDGSQVINAESGAFARVPRGEIDLELDRSTKDPGIGVFEKMISGAYFGTLATRTLKEATRERFFSVDCARRIQHMEELSARDVGEFSRYASGAGHPLGSVLAGCSPDDLLAAELLIEHLVERAAKLSAVNVASMVLKSAKGERPYAPMCVNAEGSMLFGMRSLRVRMESYLKEFLFDRKKRYYELIRVENASLIGAAIAGLTH